jgi:hypothetical protein
MRRTVSLGISLLAFVSWLAPIPARADDVRQEPWESHTAPRPAPEDIEAPGPRPQERGIPDTWRRNKDATEGASRTDTPGASKTTTTEDEE